MINRNKHILNRKFQCSFKLVGICSAISSIPLFFIANRDSFIYAFIYVVTSIVSISYLLYYSQWAYRKGITCDIEYQLPKFLRMPEGKLKFPKELLCISAIFILLVNIVFLLIIAYGKNIESHTLEISILSIYCYLNAIWVVFDYMSRVIFQDKFGNILKLCLLIILFLFHNETFATALFTIISLSLNWLISDDFLNFYHTIKNRTIKKDFSISTEQKRKDAIAKAYIIFVNISFAITMAIKKILPYKIKKSVTDWIMNIFFKGSDKIIAIEPNKFNRWSLVNAIIDWSNRFLTSRSMIISLILIFVIVLFSAILIRTMNRMLKSGNKSGKRYLSFDSLFGFRIRVIDKEFRKFEARKKMRRKYLSNKN
ncbi:hypothetical protein ACFSN5_05920 [Streptococcus tangpeifui]|uniref:hypothetical protein n=1 Tax=Streptococcus tangpeifui TaxID=2709400 RepID=UPI0013ECB4C3|nr:hypothetical protein [Streptococcus sp. ZJ1593]